MGVRRTAGKPFQGLAGYPFELHFAKLLDFKGATCASASNSRDGTERIRACETERVLRKLDLSRGQAKAVERLSHSLVDELIHGPMARVTAIIDDMSRSAAAEKVWRDRRDS
jgi:glutamyl-tRNA reductase